MALVEKIAAGRIPDTQPSVRSKVRGFVKIINSLKECVNKVSCISSGRQFLMNIKGMSVANLLREIIMAVNYEEYLKESHRDWTARFAAHSSFPRTHEPPAADGKMSRSLSPTQQRASLPRSHRRLRKLSQFKFPNGPSKSCGLRGPRTPRTPR